MCMSIQLIPININPNDPNTPFRHKNIKVVLSIFLTTNEIALLHLASYHDLETMRVINIGFCNYSYIIIFMNYFKDTYILYNCLFNFCIPKVCYKKFHYLNNGDYCYFFISSKINLTKYTSKPKTY